MQRFTLYGLSSLIVGAAAGCGANLNQDISYGLRDWLSQAPGLGWVDPVTTISATRNIEAGQRVYLDGRVEQQLPLIEQGLYQLVDTTGSIWVVSSISPPAVGESLVILAEVRYEPIPMAGQDIGESYVEEIARYPQK